MTIHPIASIINTSLKINLPTQMKFNIKRKGIKAKWIRRGFVKIEGDKIKWLHNPKTMVCRWMINKTTKDLICNKDRHDKLQNKMKITFNIPANVMSFLKLWNEEADDCEGRFLGGRPIPTWVK